MMRSAMPRMALMSGLFLMFGCSEGEGQALVTGRPATLADVDTAPYWPAFQGPRGDNISDDTGLLREWPADGPTLVWTAEGIGQGYSTVSLARGLIFTAGSIGDQSVVTALDLNGEIRWQTPAGGTWTGSHPGTRSTPTFDEDRVYYQNPLGELFCLNAATGEPIWNVNVLERFGAATSRGPWPNRSWSTASRVISTPGGPETAVVALDKMTGETVWQSESASGDSTSYATPTLVEYEGKRLIIHTHGQGDHLCGRRSREAVLAGTSRDGL